MNTNLRIATVIAVLIFISNAAAAYTFDWKGTSSNAWNNSANWTRSGSGGTSTWPGQSGSADIVRIGVTAFGGNQPTLSASVSIASIEFGDNNGSSMTLTVNTGVTLAVTGSVTQDHNNANGGITTTITGSGTAALTCASLTVGDNTAPPSPSGDVIFGGNLPATNKTTVNCNIPTLTVNGNLTLNTTSSALGTYTFLFVFNTQNYAVNNPVVNLNSGTLTVNNIVTTNSAYVNKTDGFGTTIQNNAYYNMDLGASTNTLNLLGASPITAATGASIDFVNSSGTVAASTVNYEATSGTQVVYNSSDSYINTSPTVYPNLTLSAAAAKTVHGGSLTVGGALTTSGGTVDLYTNNPSVTVSSDWTNSCIVDEGSGAVSVGGNLTVNAGATINGYTGSASTTITGTTTNSGSILENAENMTYTGAVTNNFVFTCGWGTTTLNGNFSNNTGGTFTCSSGSVFFNANYTNSATFTASTGTVYFNKAGAQTLTDNSASGTTFNNVTVENSGTKTLAGTGGFYVTSTGVLTMGGTASLAAGGFLTLKSDASGSATVAAILSTASITGNVNVQRYVTGGSLTYRGYRLMSSPVYSGTDTYLNNVYSINYLKNSIYLTATTTTGGFDNTSAANPTLYLYRENMTPAYNSFLTSNYRGINTINNAPTYKYTLDIDGAGYYIPVGNGFLCWFRGNRGSASYAAETVTSYVPQSVTLSTTGTLNQQSVTVHNWFSPSTSTLSFTSSSPVKGYNLVGNPYASSIDWETFQSTVPTSGIYGPAIGTTIYVLDPVSHNYGAYVKGGGGIGTNNASNIISSGQGFFVVASSTLAQVIFNESAKTNAQATGASLLMGKPADQSANGQYLRLQLAKDSVNTDDILIRFNRSAKTAFDPVVDAPYKTGYGTVSLASISSDNTELAINMRPFPTGDEKIPLAVSAGSSGIFTLNMKNIVGVPQLYDIWLIDTYKKDSLDMRHNATYSFNILKNDTASFGARRFYLAIRQNPARAYHLLSFSAVKANTATTRRVQLSWTTENEENYTDFTIERSTDTGKTWTVAGSAPATGIGDYGVFDNYPALHNLYRLKSEDINGTISYSDVIPISYANQSNGLTADNISVYPNPASSVINLNIINPLAQSGPYRVMITNSLGLQVMQASMAETAWQTSVSNLVPGTYIIKVFSSKNGSEVGSARFVKL
ncbi:MAG: T9SS type A sorting domain-containing protein [Bacteroidetes bacterium]|nr:T9SS type A sorting domain-containing protein [Bacteroidota bacterium]